MDQLTRDCIAARQAGMSYGKWKALHYVPPVEVETPKQEEQEEPEVAPKEVRVCRICGKPIPPEKRKDTRYCSQECIAEGNRQFQNAYYHRKKERMKANGKI